MSPRGARIAAFVLAMALGQFLYLRVREAWTSYWLLRDARKGTALVTKEWWSGHNAVDYKYVVDGREYASHGGRNWDDPKHRDVRVGQESVVYFSASHPWLSQLSMPRTLVEGAPVVLVVLALELFAVITVIKPTSGWAFSFVERERKSECRQTHGGSSTEAGTAAPPTSFPGRFRVNKLTRFRLFVGVVCVTVLYVSASFANGLFHAPDQGTALNLLLFLLGEAASAVAVVAFLGLVWAAFAPRWVSGVFRFAWGHLKYAVYVFYAMLALVGLYAAVLRIFGR